MHLAWGLFDEALGEDKTIMPFEKLVRAAPQKVQFFKRPFPCNPCVHPLSGTRVEPSTCRTVNDSPRASTAPNSLEPKAFEILLGRALIVRLDFFGPPQLQLNNKNKPNTAPSREVQRARHLTSEVDDAIA